jgi:arylformamidase
VKFFDLSRPITAGMPAHPGDPPVRLAAAATHEADGYAVTEICLGSHAGTHVDAPRHFVAGGRTLYEYPVERLVAPAVLVDCTQPDAARDHSGQGAGPPARGAPIDASCLAARLREFPPPPAGGIVLLRTNGRLLDVAAAQVLVDLGVGMVGTDAPSLDAEPYPVHRLLLEHDVLLLEDLCGLELIEPGPLMCACLPLPVVDTDGAPARVVAWR